MPELVTRVQSGDELLFCGRERAVHLLDATLANEYTLRYLMTGAEPAHGERKFHLLVPIAIATAGLIWYLVQETLGIFLRPWPAFFS